LTTTPPNPVLDQISDPYAFEHLLTQSPRMLAVFDQIRLVARTDATALILGETGTGKELVSRAIHQRSNRRDKPFVSVNCGAFTETLLESELFGHERGSFTGAVGRREGLFEMADGGTLFLDELGETSLSVQVNLLRVLEEMTFRRVGGRDPIRVDVRIIAATNVELERAVEEGRFRRDLFYRLSVFPLHLPPLRDRREDIPLLLRHFLDTIAVDHGLEPPSIAPEALAAILTYGWPGNVRQLRAMCERWVIARSGQRVTASELPREMTEAVHDKPLPTGELMVDEHVTLADNLERAAAWIERTYLERVLRRHRGHLGETASAAGISRRTLYTKMLKYGLDARSFREREPQQDKPKHGR
jgi:two-component system response regulator AtoC